MLGGLRHPNVVWVYGVVLPGQTQSFKDKMSRCAHRMACIGWHA